MPTLRNENQCRVHHGRGWKGKAKSLLEGGTQAQERPHEGSERQATFWAGERISSGTGGAAIRSTEASKPTTQD